MDTGAKYRGKIMPRKEGTIGGECGKRRKIRRCGEPPAFLAMMDFAK